MFSSSQSSRGIQHGYSAGHGDGNSRVTTNIPGPSEVIEENVSGLLAEAKDSESLARAMEKLLQDDVLRSSMAHKGIAGRKSCLNGDICWNLLAQTGNGYFKIYNP